MGKGVQSETGCGLLVGAEEQAQQVLTRQLPRTEQVWRPKAGLHPCKEQQEDPKDVVSHQSPAGGVGKAEAEAVLREASELWEHFQPRIEPDGVFDCYAGQRLKAVQAEARGPVRKLLQ